ncbi:hypothetical protein ACKP2L_05070 [Oenococcus alcoholitolerans]|uniref:hypothetical protein n=1 Tax=Oenococcus alcoholitolerans TaxID=931074 RepID=UPI003F700372
MTFEDFLTAFKNSTALPIHYLSWNGSPPELPYCLYLQVDSDDQYADDSHYLKITAVRFEFYSNKKDLASQASIETFFDANDIPWNYIGDTYIDEEGMEMAVYQIKLFKE